MPALEDIAKTIREQRSQLVQQHLMESLPRIALTGAAVGAGGHGLLSLVGLLHRNLAKPTRSAYSPVLTDIPYPEEAVADEQERRKAAALKQGGLGDMLGSAWDEAKRIGTGEYADSILTHPLGAPLTLGAGFGGAVGGYKLMDWLLNRQKKKGRNEDLSTAKQDYEQALLEQQVAKRAGEKTAAEKLGEELNRLADNWAQASAHFEKAGFTRQALGAALGAYLATGGVIGGLTGIGAYDFFSKRQPAALLRKAQREHRRDISAMRPAPIYAHPVPMLEGQPAPSATEQAGEVLDSDEED